MRPPTYSEIASEVRLIGGFAPKSCWIAHVKSEYGLTMRTAPNRIDAGSRKHPCPADRRPIIVEAMRRLGMIRQ
jgi:hypothetical protein